MSVQLLDFYADWCGPCKEQKPIVETLDEEFDELDVAFVDIEDDEDGLAQKYHVQSLPTLVLLDEDGDVVNRFIGMTDKQTIVEDLDPLV